MTEAPGSEDAVVIERSFAVPVRRLWQLWTDPHHFAQWYGPIGSSIPVAEMDVRVGGARRVCMQMQTPNGVRQMWFVGEFTEIREDELLVYTDSLADEEGNILSPADVGLPEGYPTTTEVRVELEDLGGRTRMVLTHAGIPPGSPGAAGWTMALDKLAANLAGGADR